MAADSDEKLIETILVPRARRFLVTWSGNGYELSRVALGTRMDCDRTYVSLFHASRMRRTVWKDGNYGGQREQAEAGWISLFCLQILFVLACF